MGKLENCKTNSLGFYKDPKDTKVVVAMSGGVDSSVVASMLAKEGYKKALTDDLNFLEGLNVCMGNVTYKAVADIFGHKYISPKEAIK